MKLRVVLLLLAVYAAVTSQGWAADAQKLYDQKCMLCHSIKGEGGKKKDVGGPLDGVGAKRSEEWLRAYMADPKSQMPDAKMPKIKLSPDDMTAIIEMMLSLK